MNIFSPKNKILVLAAHPDDEVLGCGGTLIHAVRAKSKIKIVFLGEGVSARFAYGKEDSKESLLAKKIRENEAKKALKLININDYYFGDRHCTKFDKYPLSNFVKEIEKILDYYKPNIIFTHSKIDLNIDHGIVHQATMIACRPRKNLSVKKIFSFEVPCSSNWTFEEKFNPNYYIDISSSINLKVKAFSKYKNETRPFPFPRSEKGIKTLAKFRGMQSGLKFAEAFRLERALLIE